MFDYWQLQTSVGSVFTAAFGQSLAYLPKLIGAVLLVIAGLVLGNWVKSALGKALSLLRFDNLIADTKFRAFLDKAEINGKLEYAIGGLAKWLVVLIFFIAATNVLGLTSVSDLLVGILGYLPSVFSAVIVLAIGVLLAGIVEKLVKGALVSIDLHTSRLMGKVASYTVVTIAALASLSELRIATEFVSILFIGFVAMLSLGLGLALGLGGKDLVAKLLEDWYTRLQKDLKKKAK